MARLCAIGGLLLTGLIALGADAALAASPCGKRQMTPAQLNQALSDDVAASILVLDTRARQDFLAGTIPGAVNTDMLQKKIDGTHEDRQNAYIVVVTKKGRLDSARQAWVKRLCDRDIETRILQGGTDSWQAQGFGLELPEERLTLPGTVPFIIPRGLCEMNEPVQEFN